MSQLPLFVARAASGDPGEWLQFLLVVLFLAGGAIRAIFQSKKGEKPPAPRSSWPRAGERSPETLREGLERWRELMEGRAPQPAPPPRRPQPARPSAPRRPVVPEPEPEPSHESLVHLELSEPAAFAATPTEEELEARRDETASVEVLAHRAVAELAIGHGEIPPALRAARLRRWRSAVLAAEAFARPLALRHPESLPGALPR